MGAPEICFFLKAIDGEEVDHQEENVQNGRHASYQHLGGWLNIWVETLWEHTGGLKMAGPMV